MILIDINAIPAGMDVYTWFDLLKEKYCLYDSKLGEKPVIVDEESIALYDINSMDNDEIIKAKSLIDEIIAKRKGVNPDAMDVVNENNKKLIKYLREINNT